MFKTLKSCLLIVIFLLLLRFLMGTLVLYVMPMRHWTDSSFELKDSFLERGLDPVYNVSEIWTRWDTGFYMSIARGGYDEDLSTTNYTNLPFFPLYPALIKIFSFFSDNYLVDFSVALILSNIFFALSLWVFHKLLTENLGISPPHSTWIILLLLAFPGSYFFSLVYTESLFLLLSLSFTYMLFNKKFLASALLLSLIFITRLNGVAFMFPFLVYVFFSERSKGIIKTFLSLVVLSIFSMLPLFLHFLFLKVHTGTFFASFIAQKAWNNFNFFPLSVFSRYFQLYGFSIRLEFILSILLIIGLGILLIFSLKAFKRDFVLQNKLEYITLLIAFFFNFLIISGVNNFSSIFRYVSVLFPAYIFFVILLKDRGLKNMLPYLFMTFISFQSFFYILFLVNIAVYGF